MTSTASSRYKVQKQGLGDNTNTWGDTLLNVGLETLDRGSKGYEAIAMTGDTTLTWSNYSASNSGQVAVIRLTGSLSSAANLVVPSVEWQWDAIINATGATITVKTSAGSGVTIPTGYQAAVYNNGSDCVGASPTRVFGDFYAGGQVKNLTAGTATTDAVNKTQLDAAIAAAGTLGDGTFFNSATDTTRKFLASALTIQVSGLVSVALATVNGGSNEQSRIAVSSDALAGVRTATISSGTTAMTAGGRYLITGGQGDLPTLSSGQAVIVELDPASGTTVTVGRNSQTIDGTAEDDTYIGDGGASPIMLYSFSGSGAVKSEIVGSIP